MPERKRAMVITTGLSLFESASWSFEGELAKLAPGYRAWLTQNCLNSLGERRRAGLSSGGLNSVEAELRDALSLDNAQIFASLFDHEAANDLETARFSAGDLHHHPLLSLGTGKRGRARLQVHRSVPGDLRSHHTALWGWCQRPECDRC